MLASLRKALKLGSTTNSGSKKNQSSFLLTAFLGTLEDVLLWKKMWFSLSFILLLNLIFFMCIHLEVNFFELFFCICATILSIDAFETWLKYKHRTACLKKLASHDTTDFNMLAEKLKNGWRRKWMEFLYLRHSNPSKSFLVVNIFLSILFITGKYISGYILLYLVSMCMCFLKIIAPPIVRLKKKIQQHAESDVELEGLIPEVSDIDIKLLSIEPEQPVFDDRQSLDYWKPEDLPIEEASDSSDNSSLVTDLSKEKITTFDKDVETSDSSGDEYMPLEQQRDQLQSTLEVVQPASTWSSTAYNAFFDLTGAVANIVYSASDQTKRKRVSSIDSSDGFEIIDKNDLK